MDAPVKCISSNQNKILLEFKKIGKMNFSRQKFFKNRRSFNESMNELLRCGWLEKRMIRLNGHYANEYLLTSEGKFIINAVFVVFNESNNGRN